MSSITSGFRWVIQDLVSKITWWDRNFWQMISVKILYFLIQYNMQEFSYLICKNMIVCTWYLPISKGAPYIWLILDKISLWKHLISSSSYTSPYFKFQISLPKKTEIPSLIIFAFQKRKSVYLAFQLYNMYTSKLLLNNHMVHKKWTKPCWIWNLLIQKTYTWKYMTGLYRLGHDLITFILHYTGD